MVWSPLTEREEGLLSEVSILFMVVVGEGGSIIASSKVGVPAN